MTPSLILSHCQSLTAVISDLGFKRPEVSAFINFYAGENFSVTVSMRVGDDWNSSVSQYFHGHDFAELLNQARAWVFAQKTPEEIRKEKFIAQLGRVIDEGKQIGFDVDFMNRMRRFRPIDFAVAARPSTDPTMRRELVGESRTRSW